MISLYLESIKFVISAWIKLARNAFVDMTIFFQNHTNEAVEINGYPLSSDMQMGGYDVPKMQGKYQGTSLWQCTTKLYEIQRKDILTLGYKFKTSC